MAMVPPFSACFSWGQYINQYSEGKFLLDHAAALELGPGGFAFFWEPSEFFFGDGAVDVDDEFAEGFVADEEGDLGVVEAA